MSRLKNVRELVEWGGGGRSLRSVANNGGFNWRTRGLLSGRSRVHARAVSRNVNGREEARFMRFQRSDTHAIGTSRFLGRVRKYRSKLPETLCCSRPLPMTSTRGKKGGRSRDRTNDEINRESKSWATMVVKIIVISKLCSHWFLYYLYFVISSFILIYVEMWSVMFLETNFERNLFLPLLDRSNWIISCIIY